MAQCGGGGGGGACVCVCVGGGGGGGLGRGDGVREGWGRGLLTNKGCGWGLDANKQMPIRPIIIIDGVGGTEFWAGGKKQKVKKGGGVVGVNPEG